MTEKRVFVGLEIPDAARKLVAEYIDNLRATHKQVRARWLPPEDLHVTVRFVGNVDEAGLDGLTEQVASVAAKHQPITATLEGTGNFEQRRVRADALWIGIDSENDQLPELAADVADAGGRKFIPHLTIARLKDPAAGKDLLAEHLASSFGPVPFVMNDVLIYESTLTPTGSVYNVLSRHPLGAD